MQKSTKIAILLALSFSSISVVTFANTLNHYLPKPNNSTSNLKLPPITALRVGGFVTVHLITSPTFQSASYVIEGPHQPQWVSAGVMGHTLYLRRLSEVLSGRPSVITVKIPQISYLSLYGNAKVYGRNIRSGGLTIRANDYARVNLTGMVNMHKIIAHDHSRINVRWINAKKLILYADGDSRTTLAGTTENLTARLNNSAQLDATYLRAKHVLIATQDQASAKVLPIQSLNAFAKDHSNIYYYKYPKTNNLSTQEVGNVLQLGWHR